MTRAMTPRAGSLEGRGAVKVRNVESLVTTCSVNYMDQSTCRCRCKTLDEMSRMCQPGDLCADLLEDETGQSRFEPLPTVSTLLLCSCRLISGNR